MQVVTTSWPADSVEFCPHTGAQDIFVCGTYKLESIPSTPLNETVHEDSSDEHTPRVKQVRRGKCLVFQVSSEENTPFSQIQEISLPAILDQKWLELLQKISCASDDVLCLSLDWSNRRYPTNGLGSLIVSLSNGSLTLLKPSSQGELAISDNWHAHDHEPWIAAWDYWNTSVIYSGGDDLKMKGWDERQGFDQPTFVNKRFDAGVTTIQSHPHIEHLIAVGSYDNKVRLFDTRKPLKPLLDVDVGGGAWRVKWHPSAERQGDLLVACMHDGFKVVRFGLGNASDEPSLIAEGAYEIVKRFDEHESLAYGVDWSFGQRSGGKETLIASCSFYDCALHLWSG
ncbi:WD40-repeat-containing domain protein [Melanogaster broomeanus]|nr:WD40-repeat-containing domain protein [Melanogaster broomeanus]